MGKVRLEGFHGGAGEIDGTAALLGLWLPQGHLTPRAGEGAAYTEYAALEIHVLPLEGQELALAQAGSDGQDVEGFEPVAAGSFEEAASFLRAQGLYLLSSVPGKLYPGHRITGD